MPFSFSWEVDMDVPRSGGRNGAVVTEDDVCGGLECFERVEPIVVGAHGLRGSRVNDPMALYVSGHEGMLSGDEALFSDGGTVDGGAISVASVTVGPCLGHFGGAGCRESFWLFPSAGSFCISFGFQFPAFGDIMAADVAVSAFFPLLFTCCTGFRVERGYLKP